MAGRAVIRIAGLEHFVMVRVAKDDLAAADDSPVRALTAVPREAAEKWGRIDIGLMRLVCDGIAAELNVTALDHGLVERDRRFGFRGPGHRVHLRRVGCHPYWRENQSHGVRLRFTPRCASEPASRARTRKTSRYGPNEADVALARGGPPRCAEWHRACAR